jgi:hypothetical protein
MEILSDQSVIDKEKHRNNNIDDAESEIEVLLTCYAVQ